MSLEIDVLRALLRLARRRTPPTLEQIVVRVGGEEAEVRRALLSLGKNGLVHRTTAGLRLSLPGFAVAVACAASLGRTPTTASTSSGPVKPRSHGPSSVPLLSGALRAHGAEAPSVAHGDELPRRRRRRRAA